MAVDHIDQNSKEAMCAPVSSILYLLIQLAACATALAAIGIDMFRPSDASVFKNTQCLTLWGQKSQCYSHDYDMYSDVLWAACPVRQKRFQFAKAAALISLGVLFLGLVFGFFIMECCPYYRCFIMVLNGVAAVASAAVVAVMTDSYYNRGGPEHHQWCAALKDTNGPHMKYGLGFALFIISCVLSVSIIIFLHIPF